MFESGTTPWRLFTPYQALSVEFDLQRHTLPKVVVVRSPDPHDVSLTDAAALRIYTICCSYRPCPHTPSFAVSVFHSINF